MITTKQRAYLKGLANKLTPIYQIGKNGITPEIVSGIGDYLDKNELIKFSILQNCDLDIREVAQTVSERTKSEIVLVIGKKCVLYKEGKKPAIQLPK